MGNYQIASAGDGFRIVGEFPDGHARVVGGFFTPADAQLWLCDYLNRMNAAMPRPTPPRRDPELDAWPSDPA